MFFEDFDGFENISCVCIVFVFGSFKDRGKIMFFWLCFFIC